MIAAIVYTVIALLVLVASVKGVGTRRAYLVSAGVMVVLGALLIISSPSSDGAGQGLAPVRPLSESLLQYGSWIGGGLLLVGLAALVASLLYRAPASSSGTPDRADARL